MKEAMDHFPACIEKIEAIIGYRFRDKSLITQAFTRTSFCNEVNQRGESYQSNEVLEFVGDSVLSVSIITFLMRENAERYAHGIRTRLDEGDFSNIKSKLSDKTNLSKCIMALGLERYLRLGEGDKKLGIEHEPSVMEDLFESIIGAVYLDCGMNIEAVMRVVSRMLDVSLYAVKTPPIQSSKNALQEFCADRKRRLPPPVYKTLGEEGPDHKRIYERGVYIGERLVARGKGKNQKLADSAAAEAALEILLREEAEKKSKPAEKNADKAPTKAKASKPEQKAKANSDKTEQKAKTTKKQSKVDKDRTNDVPSKRPVAKAIPEDNLTRPTTKPKKASVTSEASAAAKLKSHATKAKVATPTFKDLGESRNGGATVFRVECIFMGRSAIGAGATRPEAKEKAASEILASLSPKKPLTKAPHAKPTDKKPSAKKPTAKAKRVKK